MALAGPQVAQGFAVTDEDYIKGVGGSSGDGRGCLEAQPTELACTSLVAVFWAMMANAKSGLRQVESRGYLGDVQNAKSGRAMMALAGPQVAQSFAVTDERVERERGRSGGGVGGGSGDGRGCLEAQPTELACTSLVAVL